MVSSTAARGVVRTLVDGSLLLLLVLYYYDGHVLCSWLKTRVFSVCGSHS
jgi:hypothetical protein